jgi:hemoglobin-like flavoprotein
MDPQRIKDNFALVAKHGDDVAAYFYSDLFERDPGLRPMFPAAMGKQHEKLLGALSHIVSLVDETPELVPFLHDLGRRHQGFGVSPEHYPEVGASLVNTLRHFSGPAWSPELERDWAAAYGLVAQVMVEGISSTE